MCIVKLENINKDFDNKIIFHDFSLVINKGEFVVINGKSGCGKSTLLNIIGLLIKPTSGNVYLFNEINIKPYSRKAEYMLRNKIGYLFQNFALVDDETVYDNLKIVVKEKNYKQIIDMALEKVDLKGYGNQYIYKCSGGEQQRIAIARLLLKPCELILADEPTGSLDSYNKKIVCDLLKQLQKDGKTIVIVTHDDYLKQYADRIIEL